MKSNKGFTLIELAVVLAIIAVLAAILTPMVTNYIDQARISRATADTRTIADAIRLFKRDTGFYPLYATLADARAATAFPHKLVGPGTSPTDGHADWSGFTTTSDLATKLNTNFGLSTGTQVSNPGRSAFRGPYLGVLDADPWGNTFVVTGTNLNGSTDRGFVVSGGPNGTLDTDPTQGSSSFAVLSDDIVATIN